MSKLITRRRGRIVFAAGALLIGLGLLYGVVFAGVPYPDPTPAMAERYRLHARVADFMQHTGLAVACVGWLFVIYRKIRRE